MISENSHKNKDFSINFIKQMSHKNILRKILLISAKQVFNRSLTNNYSWMPKGVINSILNINVKGRWSIIAAIWIDREFLA